MFLPATADMVFEDEGALSRVVMPAEPYFTGQTAYSSGMLNSVVEKDCSRHTLTTTTGYGAYVSANTSEMAYTAKGKHPESDTWAVSQRLDTPLLFAMDIDLGPDGATIVSAVGGPSELYYGRVPEPARLANPLHAVNVKHISARWQVVPSLSLGLASDGAATPRIPQLRTASFRYAKRLSPSAFARDSHLESVQLRGAVAAESAFDGCTSLTSYPDVDGLAKNLFRKCGAMTFPALDLSGLSTVPEGCFDGCTGLTSVTMFQGHLKPDGSYDLTPANPASATAAEKPPIATGSIGARAFAGTKMTSLLIPCDITGTAATAWAPAIADDAFAGCTSLTDVKFYTGNYGAGPDYWTDTTGSVRAAALMLRGTYPQPTVYSKSASMFGLDGKCLCHAGPYHALSGNNTRVDQDMVATVSEIKNGTYDPGT